MLMRYRLMVLLLVLVFLVCMAQGVALDPNSAVIWFPACCLVIVLLIGLGLRDTV